VDLMRAAGVRELRESLLGTWEVGREAAVRRGRDGGHAVGRDRSSSRARESLFVFFLGHDLGSRSSIVDFTQVRRRLAPDTKGIRGSNSAGNCVALRERGPFEAATAPRGRSTSSFGERVAALHLERSMRGARVSVEQARLVDDAGEA